MSAALQKIDGAQLAKPAIDRQVEAIARVLQQSTPKEAIRWRDGKGGRKLAYPDHVYVTRTLNDAFGWRWSFEVDNEQIHFVGELPFEATCRGRLTVWLPGIETPVVKMQMGCQPIEMQKSGVKPVSIGDAMKGAGSDALKKCASLLGIALDLYDSDHDPRTNPTEAQLQATGEMAEPSSQSLGLSAQTRQALGEVMTALRDELNVSVEDLQATMLSATGQRSRNSLTEEQGRQVLAIYREIADGLRQKEVPDDGDIPF